MDYYDPPNLSKSDIERVLDFDPDTGTFTWKESRGRVAKGQRAGYVRGDGYVAIKVLHSKVLGHRLAWLMLTGKWPQGEIDHIDRDRSNNSRFNLRDGTRNQNMGNLTNLKNSTGFRGVKKTKAGKFVASLSVCNKNFYIGTFDSPKEAHEAYVEKHREVHKGFSFYNQCLLNAEESNEQTIRAYQSEV